jgi:regulator of cell morphogenesis and NO signaling
MSLDTTTTVSEWAVASPGATRIFEKFKIDYCCGGSTPLARACEKAGVEVDEIVRLLGEGGNSEAEGNVLTDFQTLSLTELIAYIVNKHHVFTREEIERLQSLLAKVCSVHGENHSELFKISAVFQKLCAELAPHMFKEERVLFPYIVAMEEAASSKSAPHRPPFGTVRNPVRMMMYEHDTAGDLLREMRDLSGDYAPPPDVCISYQTLYQALEAFEQDLHQHIHLENNILFPRALELENGLAA